MNRSTGLAFAALLLSLAVSADEPLHPEVAGAIDIVDAWIESVQAYDDVPGISVAFVHDQEMLFSKGYGVSNLEIRPGC